MGFSQSLKSKRQVVSRFKDRVQNQFNVSVAEVSYLDDWQRAGLALVSVANSRSVLEALANRIRDFATQSVDAEIVHYHWQWL